MSKKNEIETLMDCFNNAKEYLKQEKQNRKKDKKRYSYSCPYCSHKNKYFHRIFIHIKKNKQCLSKFKENPLFPIVIKTGNSK